MTIASEANRSGPYACNGATTRFPYAFKIFDEAHVRVILTDEAGVETTLALGTDYVVSGVGDDGGGAVETAVAHPAGCLVTLILNVPFTQGTDLENQGAYFAETIERALDVLTQQALQLKELIGRSVVLPVTSTVSTTELVSATLALADIQSKMEALVDIAPDIQTVAGISSEVVAAQGNAEAASTAAGTATGAASVATGAATTAAQAAALADELANAAPQTPVGSGFSARHWAAVAQALSDGFDLDSYLTTDQIQTLLESYAPATRTIAGGLGVKINGGESATLEDTVTVGLDLATDAETVAGEVGNKPAAPAGVHAAIAAALASISAVPSGFIGFTAEQSPPDGWLERNGAAISRTTYAALFAAIGTTFGAGDGSTTFNLPDARGTFDRGWDHGRGLDAGRAFGSYQEDEFKSHTHTLPQGGNDSGSNVYGKSASGTVKTSAAGGAETRPKNTAYLPIIKY